MTRISWPEPSGPSIWVVVTVAALVLAAVVWAIFGGLLS